MRRKSFVFTFVLIFCLFGFSLSALASNRNYLTTTEYDLSDPNKVKVTSQVMGAEENEQITYLAYNGENPDSDTIVYIDQAEAENGSCTFTYVTTKDKITGSVIKFGGTSLQTADEGGSIPGPYPRVVVTINTDNGEGGTVNGESVGYTSTDTNVFVFEPKSGYYLASVIVNGVPVTNEIINSYTFSDNNEFDNTLEVTFSQDEKRIVGKVETNEDLTGETRYITAIAKVIAGQSDDYGILFSTTVNGEDLIVGGEGVEKLRALGKNADGEFAIKIIDESGKLLNSDGTYYIRTYLRLSDDNYDYGEVVTVSGQQ